MERPLRRAFLRGDAVGNGQCTMKTAENTSTPLRYRPGWRLRSGNWFPWYLFLPWAVAFFCGVTLLFYVLISQASSKPIPNSRWNAYAADSRPTEIAKDWPTVYAAWKESRIE